MAEICGQFLGKGQQALVEGRLQTRQWDDDRGARHWKTEVVGSSVEMLSGRRKRDYEAESLAGQAAETTGTTQHPGKIGDAAVNDAQAEGDAAGSDEDEAALVLA